MPITYGFFNAVNHDRKYDANQVSEIFDGVFVDGIFENVMINGSVENNQRFTVSVYNGMTISVGMGRAWFNHVWILNDTVEFLEVPEAEGILDRIDAVVIEVDRTINGRFAQIKVVTGTPSEEPERPRMLNEEDTYWHALAYIYVAGGSEYLVQENVTNVVGTRETPYVTGILPQSLEMPFNFGIDEQGRYGYIKSGEENVTPFIPFRLGIDKNGNYGYIKDGADTVTPFKSGSGSGSAHIIKLDSGVTANKTINLAAIEDYENIWESLTSDNFFFKINSISANKSAASNSQSGYVYIGDGTMGTYHGSSRIRLITNVSSPASAVSASPRLSYNQNSGVLSITGISNNTSYSAKGNIALRGESYEDVTANGNVSVSASVDVYLVY